MTLDRPTDQDVMLDATSEARLVGKDPAQVSRARRDPTHPANGEHAQRETFGKREFVRAPRSLVLAWWEPRLSRRQGPVPTRPPVPEGWTRKTFDGLAALAAGEPVTARMLNILIGKGAATEDGTITEQGAALLAATRQETPTT